MQESRDWRLSIKSRNYALNNLKVEGAARFALSVERIDLEQP
jgi:hypothetical protein